MTQDELLEDLADKLSRGEITAEDYKAKVQELLDEARGEAMSDSYDSDSDSASSVAEDRIKSAARKARSYS